MKFSEFRKGGRKIVLTAAVLIAVVAGVLVGADVGFLYPLA